MRLSIGRPFVPPSVVEQWNRVRLRRAALDYAEHGWAVTPGAELIGRRFACGRPGCPIMTCHPALEHWLDGASQDPAMLAAWWRRRPHTVLLLTGGAFDAIEVPHRLGAGALRQGMLRQGMLRQDMKGPVAVTAAGRWFFFVRPGSPLRAELDQRIDVVRHGRGSWIPAAPSRMPEGPVRWAVTPVQTQWQLPASEVVQEMLVALLVRRTVPIIPRQTSTLRRAA